MDLRISELWLEIESRRQLIAIPNQNRRIHPHRGEQAPGRDIPTYQGFICCQHPWRLTRRTHPADGIFDGRHHGRMLRLTRMPSAGGKIRRAVNKVSDCNFKTIWQFDTLPKKKPPRP